MLKELQVFMQSSADFLSTVLVFPTLNSYSRLQLHEVTKAHFEADLMSFSVGVEPDRRPVICRQQLIAQWTLKSVGNLIDPKPISEVTVDSTASKANNGKPGKKAKRPDQAVFVPRAMRQQTLAVAVAEQPIPQMKTWEDEIFAMTGPVTLVPPLSDYLAFESGCVTPRDIAFRRVVEMGDFPKELKTSDLENVLHSGLVKIKDYYDLRWVDDTHALVIFPDEITASKALRINDPQIKFKPFYKACLEARSKAKTFSLEEASQREKSRPSTSTVMAKRMLSRALNNPSIRANAQDENLLKEARLASGKLN